MVPGRQAHVLDTARLLGMSYRLLWPPSRVPCVVDHARFQGGRTCQWAGFGRHLVAAIPRRLLLAWEVLILQSYVFLLPLGVLQSGWESSNRFIGCSSPPSGVAGCENAQKVEVGASQIVLRRDPAKRRPKQGFQVAGTGSLPHS